MEVKTVDIAIFDETERVSNEHLELIETVIIAAAKKLDLEDSFEVSATIVDNERIHEINLEYRSIDRPTDVISFAIEDNDEDDFDIFFDEMDDEELQIPRLLGDLFISIDKVKEQSDEFGHSFERELGFLTVHGFLHLNGYDHQTDKDEKIMSALQDEILEEIGLERE